MLGTVWVPHPSVLSVQSHDILYTMSRDILYTPARSAGGGRMPWRTMDVQQQRVEFVTAAKRGSRPFRSLCEEFGISRPTGYLWLRRYEQLGLAGGAQAGCPRFVF